MPLDEPALAKIATLFGTLTLESAGAILRRHRPLLLKAGQYVYRQSDAVDGLCVLLPAAVVSLPQIVDVIWTNHTTGRTLRLERVRAPALLGHVEIVQAGYLLKNSATVPKRVGTAKARLTSVRAVTDIQILRVPFEALNLLTPAEAMGLAALLGRGAAEAFAGGLAALHDAFVDDGTYRLAAWLRQETMSFSLDTGGVGQTARTQPLPQEEIAKQVGLRRDTLNQKLKNLEAGGVISVLPSREIVVHDAERLDQLADLAIREDFATFATTRDTISDALLSGSLFRARNLALDALAYFPDHPELRHLAVLAALRCGADSEARGLLAVFGWAGELDGVLQSIRNGYTSPRGRRGHADAADSAEDEEEDADEQGRWRRDRQANERRLCVDIPALAARLAKDAAFTLPWPGDGEAFARDALKRYAAISDRFADSYSAVNAAAMGRLVGDEERTRTYAERAIARTTGKTYWDLATLMEAYLLLGRREEAVAAAQKTCAAAVAEISRIGMVASTRLQLRRLVPVCGDLASEVRNLLRQKRVVYATGHLPPQADHDLRLWTAIEQDLGAQIKRTYTELDVGAVFCALAAGSDILLAEQALEFGASVHVVLPVPGVEFLARSVLIGDEAANRSWQERFQAVLEQAASVTVLEEDKPVKARLPFDLAVYAGNRHAAGLALLHADQWESEAVMVSIYDGSTPGSMAGTARVQADWRAYGHRTISLTCCWREGGTSVPEEVPPNCFGAALFVWLAVPGDRERHQTKSPKLIDGHLERVENALQAHLCADENLQRRILAAQMIGVFIGLKDASRALALAKIVNGIPFPDLDGVRIVLDFGGIFTEAGQSFETRIATLRGARDNIELPLGMIVMTEAFAAQQRLQSRRVLAFAQIGLQMRKSSNNPVPRSAMRYFRASAEAARNA